LGNLLSSSFSSVAKIQMELLEETLEEIRALASVNEDLNQSQANLVDMLVVATVQVMSRSKNSLTNHLDLNCCVSGLFPS
jgi:hypothetical protein